MLRRSQSLQIDDGHEIERIITSSKQSGRSLGSITTFERQGPQCGSVVLNQVYLYLCVIASHSKGVDVEVSVFNATLDMLP